WKGWAILLRQKQKKLIMLPSETMIWQPEFTDKTLSRKPGAVQFAKTFDDISLVPTFVLTPLTYLGGVFYSLTLLPPFWQGLSHLNPIVYMISGFRYGFLGINDVPLVTTFGVLVVFIVAFYLICWSLIQRGRGLRS
ncbi:ABC transporter permease, partial [Escherichia coli]